MNEVKYIYPQLSLKPSQDFGVFRVGGAGLANCLFVSARAYLRAKDASAEMLRPTWERMSIGQLLRCERDKRFYWGLFKREPLVRSFRKALLIRLCRGVEIIEGLGNYFEDILNRANEVKEWFYDSIEPEAIKSVPSDMRQSVAVHVRLGDFPKSMRVPIIWYRDIITQVCDVVGHRLDIQLFSDGRDDELSPLLAIPGVRRVFYGNALADIVAISRCGLLVAGKYSTFSAWGAYLGNVPSVFSVIDYGRVLPDSRFDIRLGDSTQLPVYFQNHIKEVFK